MHRQSSHPALHLTRADYTFYSRFQSAVGPLLLVGQEHDRAFALRGIYFDDAAHARKATPDGAIEYAAAFNEVREQLEAYLNRKRTSFDLPLAPIGTEFQQQVWAALRAIPYGTTTTYAAIANAIGRPHAVRAVGTANGRNPLSIVVPCHRVIGKDGTLTGYAGGLPNKRRLLELEAIQSPYQPDLSIPRQP